MKKSGILNAELLFHLTKLRHMDKMVICDAGYPIPEGAVCVDVSLTAGIPTFMQTLKAVLNELIFEEYYIFDNMKDYNSEYYNEIRSLFLKQKATEVSMSGFQQLCADAKLFVRTGELLPCSNILLISASGVPMLCEPLDIICN
jgi:D-ribose pyranase